MNATAHLAPGDMISVNLEAIHFTSHRTENMMTLTEVEADTEQSPENEVADMATTDSEHIQKLLSNLKQTPILG